MNPTNNNVITPSSLAQVNPMTGLPIQQFNSLSSNGITDSVASSIAGQFDTLTAQRDQQQKTLESGQTDITSLMDSLTGKTADTQMAERMSGVDTATTNQNSAITQLANLNAQASSLNREAQAIPLQVQDNALAGSTRGGNAPEQTARLRQNAIKALSIGQQSDIAMANLTGSQVALQSAKDKAQKMVDLKYEPMEEALKIKQQQYDFIKDNLTTAEKKRGEALQIKLTKEAADLAEQKQKEKDAENRKIKLQEDLNSISMEIAKNGGDPNIIKGATSVSDAIRLGAKFMSDPLDRLLKNAQLKQAGASLRKTNQEITKNSQEIVLAKAQIKAAESGTGVSFAGLSNNQQDLALKLRVTYTSESKDFVVVRDAYNRIQASASDPSAAGDLALIFNYMKVLDPGSTVREGEFATAQNSAGIPDILRARYNKVQNGQRLADSQRTDFVDRSNKLFSAQQLQQQKINDNYSFLTKSAGVPPEFVVRDITSAMDSQTEALNNIYKSSVPNTTSPTGQLDSFLKFITPPKTKI